MLTGTSLLRAFPLASRLNEQGRLEVGGCDTIELAREFGTPAYVVAEDDLRARARAFVQAGRDAGQDDFHVVFASKRPCSLSRLARGNARKRLVPVSMPVIIACRLRCSSDGPSQAVLGRSAAAPPRRTRTASQHTPTAHSPRLSSCGGVKPASTSVLRRMNSTRNRSSPPPMR